jgi:hypothetical protein
MFGFVQLNKEKGSCKIQVYSYPPSTPAKYVSVPFSVIFAQDVQFLQCAHCFQLGSWVIGQLGLYKERVQQIFNRWPKKVKSSTNQEDKRSPLTFWLILTLSLSLYWSKFGMLWSRHNTLSLHTSKREELYLFWSFKSRFRLVKCYLLRGNFVSFNVLVVEEEMAVSVFVFYRALRRCEESKDAVLSSGIERECVHSHRSRKPRLCTFDWIDFEKRT